MNMNPFNVLALIKNLQATGEDYSDIIDEQNLRGDQDFHHCLLYILTTDLEGNEISDQDRLFIICFMKQYYFQFYGNEEISVILPFLDNDILKNMTGQLIASQYRDFNELYCFLQDISNEFPSYFIQLIESYIEKYQLGEDYEENVIKAILQLSSYIENTDFSFDLHMESVKCIISLSRSIQNDEIQEQIAQELLNVFVSYLISIETKPIFQEILELRYSIEKLFDFRFHQKVLLLADFFCQQGPAFGTDESSFLYYLSEIIFHIFRDFDDNLDQILTNCDIQLERLILILLLFCVYHTDEIDNWTSDVECFFSSNSNYLISDKKFIEEEENDEIDENFLYKESHELHQFIYSEFIRLGSFQINETTNLLSLATQVSISMIGSTIPNYSTPLINLSSILFFFKLNEVEFDSKNYIETGDDISNIYFILYCSSKGIPVDDITEKIEYYLAQESEMYHLLCTSILINYSTDLINPALYSVCFNQCLKTISSFNTEEVTGVMNLLFSLADFENKRDIVPEFVNIMENIMNFLVSNLLLYQNAYQSTTYMCKLIAHFIRYIDFQEVLLPYFLDFINQLCSNAYYANLGIQLENAILNCKSSCNSFNAEQINKFHTIFNCHLHIFDLDYICDNPSIIPPILSISYFFAKNQLIDGIEEWIFCVFPIEKIPSSYFDKISPLVISFIQNDRSSHKFEILNIMIKRSDLLSLENNDNPLLYPTIAVLAHLGINNPENFERLMRELDYNFIDILTAINVRFKANLNIADDRLILVMLFIFGDNQIYNGDNESAENLSILNQTNALNFFQKVVGLIRDGKLNDYKKSLFFSSDDSIFETELMSCPLSHLLNTLIADTQDFTILQSKEELLAILEENDL